MLKEFKTFLMRGNVVDLAVAVVIGAAFGSVITSLVKDLITPLLAIPGKAANFQNLHFSLNHSQFFYGDVINAALSFFIVAASIFFLVVYPMNRIQARRAHAPTTRACPECLTEIPIAATRCSACTAVVPSAAGAVS